jgi:hypothetical protein
MDKGFLYVATGEKYIKEALDSAKTVKNNVGDVPITIVSDDHVDSEYIDDVIVDEQIGEHRGEAGYHFSKSPYNKTIYLDTDTIVGTDISDVFELLGEFDIAAAQAPARKARSVDRYPFTDVPESFPEYHRGVVGYVKNNRVEEFFLDWLELFREHIDEGIINFHDQPAMRKALYESDLRIATLPPKYACRASMGYVDGEVKVLHGRHKDMKNTLKKLNQSGGKRLHYIINGKVNVISKDQTTPLHVRIWKSIENDGFFNTLKKWNQVLDHI